ncbi:MAG: deoxyguanosinetriphosphate triphosphohydrolase [Phototrophicaceae bacterium]
MYADRKRLEAQEAACLAPYALLSQNSRGRVHHEPEPAYRTAYQRDRDRIVHSAAFRRLEYKTQVFVNDEGDYFRTRLTHTLEVAQIGRTLARALCVNEDLVETICLAHDLGHPPFGHAGEAILNQLMQAHGGFNHNHQSYRVVTELEERYERWRGLNLTYETLEGLAKHGFESAKLPPAKEGEPAELHGSLEAQIADLADELAYNAHDLDDGLKAGLLHPSALESLDLWQQAKARAKWEGTILKDVTRHHLIREIVGLLVDDVIMTTSQRLTKDRVSSPEDIQRAEYGIVGYSDATAKINRELKAFLYEQMYYHFRIVRMSQRAEYFLSGIFETMVKNPRQLPPEYQAAIPEEGVHRIVADYIASLTDRSALLEYRRLYDPLVRP